MTCLVGVLGRSAGASATGMRVGTRAYLVREAVPCPGAHRRPGRSHRPAEGHSLALLEDQYKAATAQRRDANLRRGCRTWRWLYPRGRQLAVAGERGGDKSWTRRMQAWRCDDPLGDGRGGGQIFLVASANPRGIGCAYITTPSSIPSRHFFRASSRTATRPARPPHIDDTLRSAQAQFLCMSSPPEPPVDHRR